MRIKIRQFGSETTIEHNFASPLDIVMQVPRFLIPPQIAATAEHREPRLHFVSANRALHDLTEIQLESKVHKLDLNERSGDHDVHNPFCLVEFLTSEKSRPFWHSTCPNYPRHYSLRMDDVDRRICQLLSQSTSEVQDGYESSCFMVHHLDGLLGRQCEDRNSLQFLLCHRRKLHHPFKPCSDYQDLWPFRLQKI